MEPASQAETAATPTPAQTTEATPSPTPESAAPAVTPPSLIALPDNTDDLLFGAKPAPKAAETAPVATPAPPEPAPTATPEPTATTTEKPAGETTPPVEVATEQPTDAVETPERILPHRISPKQFSDVEQHAIVLRKELRDAGNDVSLKECIELVEDRERKAKAADNAQPEAEATPDPITTLEQEVAALESQIDAFEDGGLVTSEFKTAQRDYSRKVAELAAARVRRESEQTAAQAVATSQVQTKFKESRERAIGEFPTATDPETLLGITLAAELAAWKDPSHPNHATLSEEDAPERVTKAAADKAAGILAKQLGIPKEQALASLRSKPTIAAAPAKPATEAVTPAPVAVPPAAGKVVGAPGSHALGAPAAPITLQDILTQSRTDPNFDADKYLFPSNAPAFIAR